MRTHELKEMIKSVQIQASEDIAVVPAGKNDGSRIGTPSGSSESDGAKGC